ncbi:LINE-1 reverse transcriptase [Pelobates cultripes]|uniref:LINE-1 reverse transcriptase n=1 Tax=Pelobates cultripes TaxID=61616 RepID=A0AAD1S574_PELCU|nr:LINE-1 reverse transcriptase [Pelobates cultripes]
MSITTQFTSRGYAPWRLNESLLRDDTFRNFIQKELTEYFSTNNNNETSPITIWQAHKSVMRGLLLSRASFLKKQAQKEQITILRDLRDATAQHYIQPTDTLMEKIENLTDQLNTIAMSKTSYMMQKLKIRNYNQNNKTGKLLATQLRLRYAQNKIPYILTTEGKKLYNPQNIVDELAKYYTTLYNLKTDA